MLIEIFHLGLSFHHQTVNDIFYSGGFGQISVSMTTQRVHILPLFSPNTMHARFKPDRPMLFLNLIMWSSRRPIGFTSGQSEIEFGRSFALLAADKTVRQANWTKYLIYNKNWNLRCKKEKIRKTILSQEKSNVLKFLRIY